MAENNIPDAIAPELGSYDHPDPTGDRQRKAEASLKDEQLKGVESAILSTKAGREWLWGILNSFHVFETRIAMSGSEFENGHWSGERECGIRLLRKFTVVSPENFALMFRENDTNV